jgi:hypothetical protein
LADLYLSDTTFANRDEEGASLELRIRGAGVWIHRLSSTALELESEISSERTATAVSGVKISSVCSGTDELNFDIVLSGVPPVSDGKRHGDRLLNTCSGRETCEEGTLVGAYSFCAGNENRVGNGLRVGSTYRSGCSAFEGHNSLRRVATRAIRVRDRRNISVYYRLEDRHFIILKILFSFKIWKKNQLI